MTGTLSAKVSSPPLLEVRELNAGYGPLTVVHDCSFSVTAGEIVGVLGRNGAGKTTALMAIAGYLKNCRAEIVVDGRGVFGPPFARMKELFGVVLEGRSVFPSLTVKENLEVARVEPSAVFEIFPELGARSRVPAGMLSGGEQQMLSLGRAMARRPSVLLIDEISFGLSPVMCDRLFEALTAFAHDSGPAIVLVEQHLHYAAAVCSRVLIMHAGRMVLDVPTGELASRAGEIERLYLADPIGATEIAGPAGDLPDPP